MKNFVLRYGIIAGCLSVALASINWFFVAQTFGQTPSQVVGYLSVIIALLCVPLGIKYYRDKLNKGVVSFGQGFNIGIGITLINATIMFFYSLLFFVIEGEKMQAWREQGMTHAELEEFLAQIAAMPQFAASPWFQALITSLMIFLVGLIINLISSMLLKKSLIPTPS